MSSGNGHDKPPGSNRVVEFTDLAARQQQDALEAGIADGYELTQVHTMANGKTFAYLYKDKH